MQNSKTNIKKIAWTLSLASGMQCLDVPGEYIWAFPGNDCKGSLKFYDIRQRMKSIFSSGNSIKDLEIIKFIQKSSINSFLLDPWIVKTFEEKYMHWIKDKNNCNYNLKNLDLFKHACYSQGSQESFLNFYMVNKHKRFRLFKGEYWWHMDIWTKLNLNWKYIEDDDIKKDDVCIVSYPFALTGKKHQHLDSLIEKCEKNKVEILLDFIYLPNSMNRCVDIDLSADCIKQITFSMSKTFPVQCAKIAIRFSKKKILDAMDMSNDENVANRFATGLGVKIMEKFSIDYMVKKYQDKQKYWCKKLELQITDVVHFAVGQTYCDLEPNFISPFNLQTNRYNLGMLYENENLLKHVGLYN